MSVNEVLPLIAAISATGIIAGILAGLLGVGGGIVIVPVLYSLFAAVGVPEEIRMHLAVGTSLSTIVMTSLSSLIAHNKRGSLDASILRSWGVWIAAGSVGGAILAGNVSGMVLKGVFAVIAGCMSIYMLSTSLNAKFTDHPPTGIFKVLSAIGISGASAIMGIGGGTIFVPFFNAVGVAVHKSVGTAAGIGLIIAIPGTIGFMLAGLNEANLPIASLGYINLLGLILLVPFTTLAAPLGVRFAHALSPIALKRAFGIFLLITSTRMAISMM